MKKITWCRSSIILVIIAMLCWSFTTPAPRRIAPAPNVIFILMDDMGYGDLECYGGFPYHTPNINKLAAGGMRFTNFYAAQATCSASRAAFLRDVIPIVLALVAHSVLPQKQH